MIIVVVLDESIKMWINPPLMKWMTRLNVRFTNNDVIREVNTDISWIPTMSRSMVVPYSYYLFYFHKNTVRVNGTIILQTRKH